MAARLGIGGDGDRARTQRKALLGEDDATMVFETSKEVTVVTTFDQMSLKEDLLRGIYAYGEWGGCNLWLAVAGVSCVVHFTYILILHLQVGVGT